MQIALATSPADSFIDQNDSSTQQGPTIAVSSSQSLGEYILQLHLAHAYAYTIPQEPISRTAETLTNSQSPLQKAISTTRDSLKVAGRFIQTLMTKLPAIADGNPAKMALSLAKVIIKIKKV